MAGENIERSLVLIKPDALKNSLTGYILSQFSEFHTGLRFAGLKVVSVNLELAEEHFQATGNLPPGISKDYLKGVGRKDEEMVILLDVEQLLSPEELEIVDKT